MTLSSEVTQIVEEIFSKFGERKRLEVKEDPEACLVSLLLSIREYVKTSTSLDWAVESATYDSNIEEARKILGNKEIKVF